MNHSPISFSRRDFLAGGAALSVDPQDLVAFRLAIEKILKNRRVARDLREKGLRRAEGFTWGRTALQTIEVYRQAAERWENLGPK